MSAADHGHRCLLWLIFYFTVANTLDPGDHWIEVGLAVGSCLLAIVMAVCHWIKADWWP